MKYPIGIQDFKTIREDGFVCVDKSALLYDMVNRGKIYFLNRPRRFGKSLLLSTLKYYFSGEKELFEGLAIESLEHDWESYPIFYIDFNSNDFTRPHTLQRLLEGMVADWEQEYGFSGNSEFSPGERLARLLAHVHKLTGKRCVVLVDEYDKPLLDVLDTGYCTVVDGQERTFEDYNRETLKAFYSTFKAADADLKFVMLTGVTKFSQVSVFSGFNQQIDISMDGRYDALCGITTEEIEHYFTDAIGQMAKANGVTDDVMRQMLQRRYDGYHFSRRCTDVYNPFSLLNVLNSQVIEDYWFRTGAPIYLARLLEHTDENLNELTGRYYDASEFVDYKADAERPLPMIYQSGYLTIKDYDPDSDSYLIDLPNDEVKKGFLTLLASGYLGTKNQSAGSLIVQLVRALSQGNLTECRKGLTAFFASIPYTMRRKDNERERERYFHYTFYLLFRLMSTYTVLTELQQSEGRADCVIQTRAGVYIFEFKLDGTAAEALGQIESKGYARPYAADARPVHKVGVSFSSATGTVDDWAEA